MAKLTVSFVTPDSYVVNQEVDQVVAPSVMGEVGILPDHLPLLADLEEGRVGLYRGSETDVYAISGGFIEVSGNVVTLLAETAEHASAIDRERAEKSLALAESRLEKLAPDTPEHTTEMMRARRARTRLQVAAQASH